MAQYPVLLRIERSYRQANFYNLKGTSATIELNKMNKTYLAVIFACVFAAANAAVWNDFRVKYDVNPVGHFNRVPKTQSDAVAQGWSPILSTPDCLNSGRYNGHRYLVAEDYSLVLLFDVNGVIAGLQMLLPHSDILTPDNTFRFGNVPYFMNNTFELQNYFVLTAYFVDPSIICTTGRNESDLINVGTGDGVWIQAGPTPANVLEIPMAREAALNSGWSDNNCFAGMGAHSWYRMEDYEAVNCDEQVPVFGLWNRAMELQGFGFSVSGTTASHRFENPPTLAVSLIAGSPAPQCLLDSNDLIGSTTMHVYFVDNPWLITCI